MSALLVYLAAGAGRRYGRAALAEMLWPELPAQAARFNLRHTFFHLRQALDGGDTAAPLLLSGRDWLAFNAEGSYWLDLVEFSAAAPSCISAPTPEYCDPCIAQMERMAALYRGEFMAGFALPDSPQYEDWLYQQREALHQRALTVLERLSDCHEQFGHYARALPFAWRFLELEPWNEAGHRRTMRLLALSGQKGSALAQYEACCRALQTDLGVAPDDATRRLAEAIRNDALPPTAPDLAGQAPTPILPLEAERRQVTVLYGEFAAPGAEDDPDEVAELIAAAHARCTEIVRHHGGHAVPGHGGGLLAYFGYPRAAENAARRAVTAALAAARDASADVELRVGVHTGLIVSGSDREMPDPGGATTRLAIQLAQLAASGTAILSAETERRVAAGFVCTPLGTQRLAGWPKPVAAFQVERERRTRRLAAAPPTPLVGRTDELTQLKALWEQARRGDCPVALVRGEPGLGKSRLVQEFAATLAGTPHTVIELRCAPEYVQTPFHPLAALIEGIAGIRPQDAPVTRFAKLARRFGGEPGAATSTTVPLFAELLGGLPTAPPYRELAASPHMRREMTLALLLERLDALAARAPVLLIGEDLHWLDPSSLELLARFVARRGSAILAVLTARLEFEPPWNDKQATTLTLAPMADAEVAALVAAVAADLAPEAVHRIVARADGVPLFAEEMARTMATGSPTALPNMLRDLLSARLDALGEAKRLAQLAATIGRDFDLDLLARISPSRRAEIERLLGEVCAAGLVLPLSGTAFQFKHALVQEAAYQSQTRQGRQAAHRQIATALREAGDSPPELLAQHLAACGETATAVEHWIEAGRLASRRGADREALTHFKSGLALLDDLADGKDRRRIELELQVGLGGAACAVHGYGASEAARAYERALALCAGEDVGPGMFRVLWGLWGSASSRSGYPVALELSQQMLRLAQRSGDPLQLQQAHYANGNVLFWQGEFAASREHSERAVAAWRREHHAAMAAVYGEDARIASGSHLALALWFLGHPERALAASAETVALAREIDHRFSLAYAYSLAALLHRWMGRADEALQFSGAALELAEAHGFGIWQAAGALIQGCARALRGDADGIEQARRSVEGMKSAMGGAAVAFLAPLAEAYAHHGQHAAALACIDEGLAAGAALGDHHADGDFYRLRGECLWATGAPAAQTEACFEQALAVSRRQGTKALELRAATSMARLRQDQRRHAEAHCLLADVYAAFREGFATPDLLSAQDLLGSLAAP